MTVIRLTRMGRTKRQFYSIEVTDSRKLRDDGRLERIGYYNPIVEHDVIKIYAERLAYWKSVGEKLSYKVASITSN
ncbi:30S ribosomal protein S16 [Campylobacter jejuni]